MAKTELVEAIVGLRTIDSGEIVIAGENVVHASPRRVADLGVRTYRKIACATG
ncbi:hypothetical protein EMGBS1_02410 [Chloroflexota bacterium]|nr:hypothetical protein EMGBS1_02410 [Chloroflexota bacterium]